MNIAKGSKVHVEFFASKPLGSFSVAGVQLKTTGAMVNVNGTCAHFRGDHPTTPKEVRVYIDVTEGELPEHVDLVKPYGCMHKKGHLEVRIEWIKGVESDGC